MKVMVAWWDLAESTQTIESLRTQLRGDWVEPWERVAGLRLKIWIADPAGNRWGAIMVWESEEAARGPMPPNLAARLIGYPPTTRARFDVEAAAEGLFANPSFAGLGLALTEDAA